EAWFSLDAILRTLGRMLFSRRLLEWSESSEADRNRGNGLVDSWKMMWIGPAVAFASMAWLTISRPTALLVAWPVWGLWVISPSIAWWVSRPVPPRTARLTAEQTVFLR